MNKTPIHSLAQQEAAYWARQSKAVETEYPGIYKHLEDLMLATGKFYISIRMAQDVLHLKYPLAFIPAERLQGYLASRKDFDAFMQHCDPVKFGLAMQGLIILGNWRLTQQVLSFDRSIAAELAWEPDDRPDAVDAEGNPLPVGHLGRLPYLSFVVVPNLAPDHPTYGTIQSMMVNVMHPEDQAVHASMQPRSGDDEDGALVSFAVTLHARVPHPDGTFEDRQLTQVLEMARPGMTVAQVEAQAREKMRNILGPENENAFFRAKTGEDLDVIEVSMPFLLYLCADNRDIEGQPNTLPSPSKTKRGLRIFAAERPVVLPVGARIGAALRQHQQAQINDSHVATGATRIGHMRRAHWHTYWKGSLKEPQKRQSILRFLPPIPVNLVPGEAQPVVRPVRA